MTTQISSSIDINEVEKFSKIADEWWDKDGKFKPLHKINNVRVKYILDAISAHNASHIDNISVLDIGCGGGILAESIAKAGAHVTGIDASSENIKIASKHAQQNNLNINYINISIEELSSHSECFDVVLNMEVIEHVKDVDSFLNSACKLVKPGGIMVTSTINRTVKSFALAIVAAEYILNWLPRGTHDWKKFLKPSEINRHLERNSLKVLDITGVTLNPLQNTWQISKDIDVNYMMLAKK